MTLLIAAKSGPGLKPNGTPFAFEPGIVIAADTRLSYANGTSDDAGLKVGITGPRGICGMASDSIDIPTQAFHYFDDFMEKHPNITTTEAVAELNRLLREAQSVVSSRLGQKKIKTTVFFGHNQSSPDRLSLYLLDSADEFIPKIRDGFNSAGSHAKWVLESFERIKTEYPNLSLHPFDGFPGNLVTVSGGVAPLVMTLINAALEVAKDKEVACGRQEGIGGAVQAAIITKEGRKVADPTQYEKLKAWQIFQGRLK